VDLSNYKDNTVDNVHNICVQRAVLRSEMEVDMPPANGGMDELYQGTLDEEIATFLNQDTAK